MPGGYGEKGILAWCCSECKLRQLSWKPVQKFFRKLKMELLCHPAVPLQAVFLKQIKIQMLNRYLSCVFISTVFIMAKIGDQPNPLIQIASMDERIENVIRNSQWVSPHLEKEGSRACKLDQHWWSCVGS